MLSAGLWEDIALPALKKVTLSISWTVSECSLSFQCMQSSQHAAMLYVTLSTQQELYTVQSHEMVIGMRMRCTPVQSLAPCVHSCNPKSVYVCSQSATCERPSSMIDSKLVNH